MKLFRIVSAAVLCFALAAVVSAQSPQPAPQSPQSAVQTPPAPAPQTPAVPRTQQPPTTPAQSASRNAPEITISGCLAQAEGANGGFTLTVVPPPATTDAARTSAATAAPTKPATYKIVGLGAAELKGHINHHVELKGLALPTTGSADAVRSATAMPQEFRASSVTMVSPTCPPAK